MPNLRYYLSIRAEWNSIRCFNFENMNLVIKI